MFVRLTMMNDLTLRVILLLAKHVMYMIVYAFFSNHPTILTSR